MHLVDRAITRTNGSMLRGLVSGFRDEADGRNWRWVPFPVAPIADERDEGEWISDEPEIVELT
jgi:hypothetical protein